MTGADVRDVARGMGMDSRIGDRFLQVGPGYGGSCFPKDTLALIRIAQEHGVSSRIVEAVVEVNAGQKARMVKKIRTALGGSLDNKRIAILGLTFKPETDDMRDSPSLTILPSLLDKGAIISAHDPQGVKEAKKLLPNDIEYGQTINETVEGADAVVLMTEWEEYKDLDLNQIKKMMGGNIFIDLRNIYSSDAMQDSKLEYFCIGS